MTSISLPLASGGTLEGDYLPGTADPTFAVLWIHGFGSHRGGEKSEAVREECAKRGWSFAAFDFRGHGASSATMHELRASGLLEDLAAIRDWLKDVRGHTRLGLVGSSMGGFAAAWFATQNPDTVVGCVLLASAFGFLERRWSRLTDVEREEWRRTDRLRVKNEWVETELGYGFIEERDQFRSVDLANTWRTPALLIHGTADDVVPDSDSLAFFRQAAYPGIELCLLKAGDHRLTVYKDEIAAKVGLFFSRLIRT
ncbi:MAG TPA: alpha/beta fold hydrolase [Gemmata sp.]|nr:alpha/beta fold hydrolase [Gemmata sp.]